ncbi:hypothetical protein PG997_014217 [Apiospora hydei]|uniref:Uncharacterized protein n=1 Tax=Apiospora hydei TaxID=1337664 RepID=A0ABR1UVP8_9PEZI
MSRTSLDFGNSPHVNSAPWLFSDPYAYQYADIPEHIRTISTAAARQPPRSEKEAQAASSTGVVMGAVEAGSVPGRVEMGDSSAPGMRFELEGCSDARGDLAKLTITSSGPTTGVASPLTPGCLQVGGSELKSPRGQDPNGEGMELFLAPTTPSTPTSPAVVGQQGGSGLLRRATATRMSARPCKTGVVPTVPAVPIAEARRGDAAASLRDGASEHPAAADVSAAGTAQRPAAASPSPPADPAQPPTAPAPPEAAEPLPAVLSDHRHRAPVANHLARAGVGFGLDLARDRLGPAAGLLGAGSGCGEEAGVEGVEGL